MCSTSLGLTSRSQRRTYPEPEIINRQESENILASNSRSDSVSDRKCERHFRVCDTFPSRVWGQISDAVSLNDIFHLSYRAPIFITHRNTHCFCFSPKIIVKLINQTPIAFICSRSGYV